MISGAGAVSDEVNDDGVTGTRIDLEQPALARARRGRRAGLPRAHRALPARAPAPLLPDPRLAAGRRGPAPGDAAGRLARARAGSRGASSLRSWLYPIATNRCLNALRDSARRPAVGAGDPAAPEPTRRERAESPGSSPTPTRCSRACPTRAPGPEARYETKEAVALAFVTGLQHLPPRSARCSCCATCSASAPPRSRTMLGSQRGLGQQRAAAGAGDARAAAAGAAASGAGARLAGASASCSPASPTPSSAATSTPSSRCSPTTPWSACRPSPSTRAATRSPRSCAPAR